MLTKTDESKNEDYEAASQKLAEFYEIQYRLGTIAIITNLKDNAEEIFKTLKSRIDIEQMYDSFKNTLHADRSYMRDDYQIEGWMFLNFISLLFYYKIYNVLVGKDLLKKYSPLDVLTHLSRIHKLKLGDTWVLSETPKKTNLLLEKLNSPITKNLRS